MPEEDNRSAPISNSQSVGHMGPPNNPQPDLQ